METGEERFERSKRWKRCHKQKLFLLMSVVLYNMNVS